MGKAERRNKKINEKPKPDLSGESLMVDAFKRIAKINGNSSTASHRNTSDVKYFKKDFIKTQFLTDLPQGNEKTPGENRVPISEDEVVTSHKDYVDFKVDKEIMYFEKRIGNVISDGKLSIQKWGLGLVVAAIIASAGIMVAIHLFSTKQIIESIKSNFSDKFSKDLTDTNNKVVLLKVEQDTLKKDLNRLKKGQ